MTSAIKWEPIEDLKAIRDVVERTLIRPWIELPLATIKHMQVLGVRNPVDIYEMPDAFVAEMETPGLRPEDVHISVVDRKLTVRIEPPAASRSYVHRERAVRPFSRSLTVPPKVDVSGISARLQNGILVLTLPKVGVAPAQELKETGSEKEGT
jgi:HSP20 family protein